VEASNIRAATILLREQLIEKAISAKENITREEIVILRNRFWTPRIKEESQLFGDTLVASSEEGIQEFFDAWEC
jgi:hypothetical protein